MKNSTYIVLNGILPFLDVYSDYLTYEALLCSGDELFAMANLIVMFLPFAFKFALFSFDLVTKGRPSMEHLVGLVTHLPFVAPIVHILLGIRLLFFDHNKVSLAAHLRHPLQNGVCVARLG